MERAYSKPFVVRITILGFIAGLAVILLAFFIAAVTGGYSFNFSGIVEMHRIMPVLYFLDIFPLLIALASFYISRYISRIRMESESSSEETIHRQRKLYHFVEKLQEGDESVEYIPDEGDALGKAIVNLRNNISQSRKEEEIRRKEDEQRRWSAEGMARFGEILRLNNDNVEELSFQIIRNLVNYVGANQAAFYLLEDDDEADVHFRMTACYAYERRKYADRIVPWGDGLVGACALEKETIFLKKVPDSYLNITSGLGKANPRCLVLIPLKLNDQVHGVLEVASFNIFEKHQLEFMEKIAESVATTISTVKINLRTAKLLRESREQAEELALKEEQMRQNMEELQATQEEAARQSEKFISFSNSVNHTMIRADFDVKGTLTYANTKFMQKLEYSSTAEVEGKPLDIFLDRRDRVWFEEVWKKLSKGGKHFEGNMKLATKTGKELWILATFTCMRNTMGDVDKILFLALDASGQRAKNLELEGQVNAFSRSVVKADISPTGDMIAVNDMYIETLGLPYEVAMKKNIFETVSPVDRQNVEDAWDDIIHGNPFDGKLRVNTGNNDEKWLQVSLVPVNDTNGEIAKVLLIAYDITSEVHLAIEVQQKEETIRKQEELIQQKEVEQNKKLRETREEITNQYRETEKIKVRNEKLLEELSEAIVTTDHDGLILFMNKAAENLFTVKHDEVANQNVRILFSDTLKDNFVTTYLDPARKKIVGQRQMVTLNPRKGKEVNATMVVYEVKTGREITYTAFFQPTTNS